MPLPESLQVRDGEPNGSVRLSFRNEHNHPSETYELRDIAWRLDRDTGVAIAAYNNQRNLHALTPNQMMETFLVLQHAKEDPDVLVLIWTATGEKAFCSGAALRGDRTMYVPKPICRAYLKRGLAPGQDLVLSNQVKAFWDFPKPLIMAINGLAIGGGANIALANFGDMVLCSSHARFKYPFAQLSLTPELGSSMMMPFLVGAVRAKRMMMLGEYFSASDALEMGLVNEVCESAELLPRAFEIAENMACYSPETMRLIKHVLNKRLRDELDAVLLYENEVIRASLRANGAEAMIEAKEEQHRSLL